MLGGKSESIVSRYEMFQRVPDFKTALALQALFGVPVAELFAGIYEQIENEVSKRAGILERKMQETSSDQTTSRKADLLRAVAITPDINKENP